jgi:hypothetical protein
MYHPMSANADYDREFILKHAEQLIAECERSIAEHHQRASEYLALVQVCVFMEEETERRLELYRSVASSASPAPSDAPPDSPPAPEPPESSQ